MDYEKWSATRNVDKNISTSCRWLGCKNRNHRGFRLRKVNRNIEIQWKSWLEKGGVDVASIKGQIKICFRHFKRENLRISDSKHATKVKLVPSNLAVPFYYPGDEVEKEDEELHRLLSREYYKLKYKTEDLEMNTSDEEKWKEEMLKEREKINKEKIKERKIAFAAAKEKKRQILAESRELEEIDPEVETTLRYSSLLKTVSTIEKDVEQAQHLVEMDTATHGPPNKKEWNEAHLAMAEIREAILRHDWNLALKLLPILWTRKKVFHFAWKCYLQIFCHHPNSTPELVKELLQVALQTNNITRDDLKKIFCLKEGDATSSTEKE